MPTAPTSKSNAIPTSDNTKVIGIRANLRPRTGPSRSGPSNPCQPLAAYLQLERAIERCAQLRWDCGVRVPGRAFPEVLPGARAIRQLVRRGHRACARRIQLSILPAGDIARVLLPAVVPSR